MDSVFINITDYLLNQSRQIAILFAVVAIVCMALKKESAHLRYLLWLLIIAKCLVPSLITVSLAILPQKPLLQPLPESPPIREFAPPPESVILSEAKTPAPLPVQRPSIMAQLAQIPPKTWFSVIWLGGVGLFLLIVMIKAARFNRRLGRQRKRLTAGMQKEIDDLLDRFGIHAKLHIWLLDGIGQPFVWGLLRGGIYLPANFGQIGGREHRRGILMHEITHTLRFDAAVNILQTIAQAVFWFHPFVWWANRNIRAEREKCCDETAIARLSAAPKVYSSAIVDTLIAEYQSTLPVPSLAIAGPIKNIEDRIKTIMKPGKKFYNRPTIIAIVTILFLAIIAVPTTIVLTHRQDKNTEKTSSEFIKTLPNGARVEFLTTVIKVEDEEGNLIEGAVIAPDGLRTKSGHYFWRADRHGEPPTVITNTQGLVEVAYPKYANEKIETGSISFLINHPDFCPARPISYRVDGLARPIVLQKGATLRVSGYLQSKENLLAEIYPQIGRGWLYNDSWRQIEKGVFETRQLPPGPHYIRLVYLPEDGLAYFSEAVRFDAGKGETYEFNLQLKPGVRLAGSLDETVPRPVRNGRVVASAHPLNHPHHSKRPRRRFTDPSVDPGYLHWRSWREVKEDGTFAFESLPHGEVELIAICDGFISKNPPGQKNMYIGIAQTWPLKEPVTRVELKMKPTASCEIKVLDEQSQPITGAKVGFNPNVQWHSGGAQIFATCLNWSDLLRAGGKMSPDKWAKISEVADFQATSDEFGIAVIHNLPEGRRHFAVLHPAYQLPAQTGYAQFPRRVAEVELSPGQTARVTVTMQKKGADFLGAQDSDARPSSKAQASSKAVSEIPDAAKWSEGKAMMGTIATAIRAWAHDNYIEGSWDNDSLTLSDLGFMPGDLKGTYFDENNFYWNVSYNAAQNNLQFTIAAISPKGITRPAAVTLDQTGKWTIHQTLPAKARAEAARKLRRLGTALVMYAFDYDNEFPESLEPLEIYDFDEELAWARENVEYMGKGKVLTRDGVQPVPLAFDKTLLKKGEGTNVVFSDGHVEFVELARLAYLGIDSGIDENRERISVEGRFILVPQDSQGLKDFFEAEGIELPAEAEEDNSITAPAGSEEIEKFLEEQESAQAETDTERTRFLDPDQVKKLLRLAQASAKIKLLTAPKVLVFDGESATLSIMQEVMYISGFTESDSASKPQPKIERVDKGVTLEVAPKITDDQNIKLDLDIQLTGIAGYERHTYKDKSYKIPQIQVTRIVSEVMIPDGKTVLLAGSMIRSAIIDSHDESGADETTKELLILITPTINPEPD